jgi:hypothetical protein
MGRTTQSDAIQEAFLDELKAQGATVESMNELIARTDHREARELLARLGRSGRNLFLVKGVGLINVHVRSDLKGWWGILKTVREDLQALGTKYFFVLLIGRNDRFVADGYIVSDFDAAPIIKYPSIGATKFTINEKQHLDPDERLLSIGKVAKVLLGSKMSSTHT